MSGSILVVDDERSMCELLETDLRLRGYEVRWFTSADSALASLNEQQVDTVLTDLKMPGMTGIELCERIAANRPDIPVVVMTAFGSLDSAVAAIRAGAFDFVTKPIEMDLLAISLERAVQHRQLQQQVRLLREQVKQPQASPDLIGDSPVMQTLFDQISRVAQTESSVLISGESGTGKELVAKSLHRLGSRAEKPFAPLNSAAVPESLLESELFGHVKGAFTDAKIDRKGLFQEANGGTLFLDEVGEMPLTMQAKLLRALEESKARPVGGDREVEFDVRLISATNRDLEQEVAEGRFREDFYFRINVIQLDVPPLRARGNDVLLIAQHFVDHFAKRSGKQVTGLSASAAEKLLKYDWPGNVRELRNVIERAVALTRYEELAVEDLPPKICSYQSNQVFIGGQDPAGLLSMAEVERRYIQHVLNVVGGNKSSAARILGLDRKTLYRKLGSDEG